MSDYLGEEDDDRIQLTGDGRQMETSMADPIIATLTIKLPDVVQSVEDQRVLQQRFLFNSSLTQFTASIFMETPSPLLKFQFLLIRVLYVAL